MDKSGEEKSTSQMVFREPRLVRRGRQETTEHGLGAGAVKIEPYPGTPVIAFRVVVFSGPKMGTPQRRMAFVHRRESRWYHGKLSSLFSKDGFIFYKTIVQERSCM